MFPSGSSKFGEHDEADDSMELVVVEVESTEASRQHNPKSQAGFSQRRAM
jgi:hypothetical protein